MMPKKYTLTEECITIEGRKLYRIKALRNVGRAEEGDLGGFVEYNDNLSQEDDAWLYNDAKAFGNAWVGESARITGNACVYGGARVFGRAVVANKARVFERAKVYGDARIVDNAVVFGDAAVFEAASVGERAEVSGNAKVFGEAEVFGGSKVFRRAIVNNKTKLFREAIVSRRPIQIEGLRYPITITDNLVIIGCQAKSLKEWLAITKAEAHNLGHEALDFYMDYKDIIKKIVEKH